MLITARPSPTTFELQGPNGKKFMRHLATMRPWRGRVPDTTADSKAEPPEECDQDIREDDFIFTADTPDADIYYLAKVKTANDHHLIVQVYGTTTTNTVTAKFTPVYTRGTEIVLKRYSQVPGAKPWTWQILLDDIDALVIARGIELSKTGRLSSASSRLVKQLKPRKLHVFS